MSKTSLEIALSYCQSPKEEEAMRVLYERATNPFLIYRDDFVREETLIQETGDKNIKETLLEMRSKGLLKSRTNIFSRKRSWSPTIRAVRE